jgi:hypothetical protein
MFDIWYVTNIPDQVLMNVCVIFLFAVTFTVASKQYVALAVDHSSSSIMIAS